MVETQSAQPQVEPIEGKVPPMRQPTEAHKKLEKLAGDWTGDEKVYPSRYGSGGTFVGRYRHELDLGGFFVLQDYVEERDGQPVFHGHGVLGYDDKKKLYSWHWFDATGFVQSAPSYGRFEGDKLSFEGRNDEGKLTNRSEFRFLGPDAFTLRLEYTEDGGSTWSKFMEAELHRS